MRPHCGTCHSTGPGEREQLPERTDRPDFRVTGKKQVNVYWESEDFFEDLFGTTRIVASGGINQIHLNKDNIQYIDGKTLAHEYGHCLGFGHIENTIMNAPSDYNTDGRGGRSLHPETAEILRAMDGVRVIEWGQNGTEGLFKIASEFRKGYASSEVMLYAAKQWRNRADTDAFFTSNYEHFGRADFPESQLPRGTFLQAGPQ